MPLCAPTLLQLAPRRLWPALALLCSAGAAWASAEGRWQGDIAIGGSLAGGSTSATALNLRFETSRATDADEIKLNGLANYGTSESQGVRTRSADLARVGGRYDRNLGNRFFAFAGGEGETNKSGGVRSRLSANAGAGWHLLRSETDNGNVFTGFGHASTRFTDGSRRSGAEWMLGEESTHQVGPSSTFKQRLVLYPGARAIGNRATFESGLATAIVDGWTFNAGLTLRYASKVLPGRKRSERLLTFGFGHKF